MASQRAPARHQARALKPCSGVLQLAASWPGGGWRSRITGAWLLTSRPAVLSMWICFNRDRAALRVVDRAEYAKTRYVDKHSILCAENICGGQAAALSMY